MDKDVQGHIYWYTFSQGRIQYTQCNCRYEAFGETCHCYLGQVCYVCVSVCNCQYVLSEAGKALLQLLGHKQDAHCPTYTNNGEELCIDQTHKLQIDTSPYPLSLH